MSSPGFGKAPVFRNALSICGLEWHGLRRAHADRHRREGGGGTDDTGADASPSPLGSIHSLSLL